MKNSWKAFPPIAILEVFKFGWKSVMTIEHSPLRKLDPRAGHMVFTILGFMWSAIFGIVLMDSVTAFGISAVAHIMIVSGIFITAMVFNEADKRPHNLNSAFNNGRGIGGEHE